VAQAASGDREAAHSLLTELLPRIRNLVRYLIRGDSDVDDITQYVLLELLKSFRTYRAEGSLRAWSDRITVRVTLKRKKQSAHDRQRLESAATELYAVGAKDTAATDEYLTRRQMVRFLDAIPSEQREALVLHHVVGLSVPEIAEDLAVSGETIRSRLRLGIAKLRAHRSDLEVET
jgi:RNA polymerase sigma-70 factor (ECF subfamily)